MKASFFQIVCLLLLAFSCRQPKAVQLVKNGQSHYKIVIPEQASKEEIRATEFLSDHIRKISACILPVEYSGKAHSGPAIFISRNDSISAEDGFSIRTEQGSLYIEGGSGRGCIYGVSELLENCLGVKYYSPDFVIIPQNENITIPALTISDASPNTYRNVHGDFVRDQNYKDFHRLHDISDMFAEGYFVHTFHRLVPWQQYFNAKPEYFALRNGRRMIDQLCLSNEEVFNLVVSKLTSEMQMQTEKKVWSVSQNDNYSYCQCENCARIIEEEKSASGPLIRFVNRVAANFPDKVISTLAYQYSRTAPAITKPRENVQVMLCTIELNRSQPIDQDPRSISFLTDLQAWGKISKHMFLWDYTVNFAHHISPFPNLHTLQPNIQLFYNHGVKEHFQQTNTGAGHEFSELKSWLLAKLLWNPGADVPSLIHEFTEAYYGPAGVWIRKYIEHLQHEILKTGEWLDIYGPPADHQHSFLSAANVEQYNVYFDNAEKAVATMPGFLMHVQTARMPLQYAMMEIGKADMFGPRGWYEATGNDYSPRNSMLETLDKFHQTGRKIKSAYVNESGLTVGQYYHSTLRFVDVQVQGNKAFKKKVTADPLPAAKYSRGDLGLLTNGVRGANDFKVHWLGWEAADFSLVLDLEKVVSANVIEISTLYDPKSWILHPMSVACLISDNGKDYYNIGKQMVDGDQRHEDVNRLFRFRLKNKKFRFVKFELRGTLKLFDWHASAGGGSWVFVDEIVVR